MSDYHIASVSFGKDSLHMLLRLLEIGASLDEVVFYDTGMEFKAIYDIRDRVIPMLAKRGIKYTELYPEYDFEWKMFNKPVCPRGVKKACNICVFCKDVKYNASICTNPQSRHYLQPYDSGTLPWAKDCKQWDGGLKYGYSWCGGCCRWGTTDKLAALDRYTESKNAIAYIGIAADEAARINKRRKEYKRLPLAEWGMTEAEALAGCYAAGFDWRENGVRLYDILDRVSCCCCANKNLRELKNIYRFLPEYWERLKGLQSRTCRPMKGEGKSVFDLEKRFAAEIEKERRQSKCQIK